MRSLVRASASALLFSLLLPQPQAALADAANHDEVPPNWLGGSISSSRTLTVASPGPSYVVYGDLVVEPGVTLTIEPGVTLAFVDSSDFFAGGAYFGLSELIVRGALLAVGTTADSIVFRSQSGSANAWGEIRVESGSASLSHVEISGGAQGLSVAPGASATLANSTLGATGYGVVGSGTLLVATSRITSGNGVSFVAPGSVIADTEVSGGNGLWLRNTRVKGCLIHDSTYGIVVAGSGVSFLPDDSTHAVPTEIRNCTIGVSVNDYLGASGPLQLRNLLVRDCSEAGIDVYRIPGVMVNYCTVVNCGTGVRDIYPSDNPSIMNSIVASNGAQLQLASGFVNYTDLWGPVGTSSATYGSQVAVFDPGFVDPGTDYHLLTTSLFTDYSISGGEIGAYGPGGGFGQPPTGVDDAPAEIALRVLPNPSRNGRIALSMAAAAGGTARVRVLDLSGRELRSRAVELSPGAARFDIGGEPLPSGLYFVQVVHGGRTAHARASVVR